MTREEILEADTPEALFGEAAGDGRALRKAYAVLAKRHRPGRDPEAAQHIRALYEQARRSLDGRIETSNVVPFPGPVPAPEAGSAAPAAEGPEASTPPADPVVRMVAAHQRSDHRVVLDVVARHVRLLLAEHQQLLLHVLREVLVQIGEHLDDDELGRIDVVLGDPEWQVPPPALDVPSMWVADLRAFRRAAGDPKVPGPLVVAARDMWFLRPDRAARAWLRAADALQELDLDRAFAYLEHEHPALAGYFATIEHQMFTTVGEPPGSLTAAGPAIRERFPASSEVADSLPPRRSLAGVAVFAVLGGLWLRPGSPPSLLFTLGMCALMLWLFQRRKAPVALGYLDVRPTLVEAARRAGAFPREIPLAAFPKPVPYTQNNPAFVGPHPLLAFDQDPTALLRSITEKHVTRLETAWARREAEARSEMEARSVEATSEEADDE